MVGEVGWLVWELVGLFCCFFLLGWFLNTDVGSEKCSLGNLYIYNETFIYIIYL